METHGEFSRSGWSGRGNLSDLVKELERQKESKIDFVADTRSLEVKAGGIISGQGGALILHAKDSRAGEWIGKEGLTIKTQALVQLGQKQEPDIPSQFLQRLTDQRPSRAADLINGLMVDGPARRFVRCLDGQVRGFLSDRYRVLDNFDIAFAALDAVRAGGGEVVEASLSDTMMRIKFTSRSVFDSLNLGRVGDKGSWYAGGLGNQDYLKRVSAHSGGALPGGPGTVHPLVTVSNSETGHGGFNVRIGILQAICYNLATVEDVVGRVHLGERQQVGIFSEATLSQESKAIYMKARDAVRAAFDPKVFGRMVDMCRKAQDRKVVAPQSAIENIAKAGGLSDKAKEAVLAHFIRDYELTAYGVAQAVSRYAQDEAGADEAANIEDLAGKILTGAVAVA